MFIRTLLKAPFVNLSKGCAEFDEIRLTLLFTNTLSLKIINVA